MKARVVASLRSLYSALSLVLLLQILFACAPTANSQQNSIDRLAETIALLDSSVDPLEAKRAALLSHSYARVLALEYEITDPPLVHNTKVNMGLKPRGLCWHWAEDMEKRLLVENFSSLDIHRAISRIPFRIDHSTVIISAKGQTIQNGIVADPWRQGGELSWIATMEDDRYRWRPRSEVLKEKYLPPS